MMTAFGRRSAGLRCVLESLTGHEHKHKLASQPASLHQCERADFGGQHCSDFVEFYFVFLFRQHTEEQTKNISGTRVYVDF